MGVRSGTAQSLAMGVAAFFLLAGSHPAAAREASPIKECEADSAGSWFTSYREATTAAERDRRQVLLWFRDDAWKAGDDAFERVVLRQKEIAGRLKDRFVVCVLSTQATITGASEGERLLDHPAFAEMQKLSGLAIVDLSDSASPHHRHVVSVFPFRGAYISRDHLATFLDLPAGTLTQRTLIFAVRTHPDRPSSTSGEFSPLLADETESHATYQARLNLQGHHHWDSRFQAINARLPGGLLAQEVCAESWPGQSLVEAAVECVDSWRHSTGHWQAVSGRHPLFGYDMKRGTSGVWYATGIFAGRP